MSDSRKQNLKVGIFVLLLLAALGGVLFLIGGQGKLFEDRYVIAGTWKDVSGLKVGATVRLSGWDVGEVVSIDFGEVEDRQLIVTMAISPEYKARIRHCDDNNSIDGNGEIRFSSIARIETVGILGDKFVAINMGDANCTMLDNGGWIKTKEPLDILSYTGKITNVLNQLDSIGNKVDIMLGTEEEARMTSRSLLKSFQNLEDVTIAIKEGDGLVNALIYDKSYTEKVNSSIQNIERSLGDLEKSSMGIRDIVNEIKHGNGTIHTLVYDDDGRKLLSDLDIISGQITELLTEYKESDSLIKRLLSDPDQIKWLDDLKDVTKNIKTAAKRLVDGEGSAGLLLRDPTLYEDLRSLVGGAQRNGLLRAFFRQTIEAREKEDAAGWEKSE